MSPKGKGKREALEVGGTTVTVSPSPAPIGTTKVVFVGHGFPEGYLIGTISGKGPSFEFSALEDGSRAGTWNNSNAPLGIGVSTPDNPEGKYPETHWVSITDAQGTEVHREFFEVQ